MGKTMRWRQPVQVVRYDRAAMALADLEQDKRTETESRLRLIGIDFLATDQDLLIKAKDMDMPLAFRYASFVQYCKVIGLGAQVDFLRTLTTPTVARVLQEYTDRLPPTEIKLTIQRELGDTEQLFNYTIKQLVARNTASNANTTERWLYWLMQLESYDWKLLDRLLLQGDYLCAVMYDRRVHVRDYLNQPGYLGFVVGNSEAGVVTPRTSAVVVWPGSGNWLPINEPVIGKLLTQGLAEMLNGNVGMFGPLSAFRESVGASLIKSTLDAHSTVALTAESAYALLKSAGVNLSDSASILAEEQRAVNRLTGLGVMLQAARRCYERFNEQPADYLPGLIQLGWALWK